jgi:hypothetical protein
MHRHDLPERAARHTGVNAANAFRIFSGSVRKAKTVAGGAAIWVSRRTTNASVIDASYSPTSANPKGFVTIY